MRKAAAFCLIFSAACIAQEDPFEKARKNGEDSASVVHFCNRFLQGWMSFADPQSGLIPRNLTKDFFWNAQDSAADNYPFMVLTASLTGNPVWMSVMEDMLDTERDVTTRLGSLPDDFLFSTQSFRASEIVKDKLIFGAAEYAKDGLVPITEWMGASPWSERMQEMMRDIWKNALYDSPVGLLPTQNVEVAGDLLQTLSRLYWMTGKQEYMDWTFRLADKYLLHDDIPNWPKLQLDDHGCEIINGLSEAYYLACHKDSGRREAYKPRLYAILECVLKTGRNEDGLLYNVVNPKKGEILSKELTDNWGYNYNAFLVVAELDNEEKYREAARFALSNIHKYLDYKWEGGSADGYADTIESGLNLLNRIPLDSAFQWVDDSMKILLAKQRPEGVIEGWHGDGNSARTAWMWALWKTCGIVPSPWREDLKLGAVCDASGTLHVSLGSDWPWSGSLKFDRPRHRYYFHMPSDYARLNQFQEWFCVETEKQYRIEEAGGADLLVSGADLLNYKLETQPGKMRNFKVNLLP